MKATLTIELEIPDIDLMIAKARVWEKEHNYKYGNDESGLLTDYLLNENKGYSIEDTSLDRKEK